MQVNIYEAQKMLINDSYPSFTGKLLWELLKPGDGELLTYVASGHGEHWINTKNPISSHIKIKFKKYY